MSIENNQPTKRQLIMKVKQDNCINHYRQGDRMTKQMILNKVSVKDCSLSNVTSVGSVSSKATIHGQAMSHHDALIKEGKKQRCI
jgi:hypothetical protein